MNRKKLISALVVCVAIIAIATFGAYHKGLLPPLTPTSIPSTTATETVIPTSCVVGDFNVTIIHAKWAESQDDYTPQREDGNS